MNFFVTAECPGNIEQTAFFRRMLSGDRIGDIFAVTQTGLFRLHILITGVHPAPQRAGRGASR